MYITSSEYNDLTGGDAVDATDTRIKRASRLLDVRIGNYKRETSGFKLDLDDVEDWQSDAVKDWVAWMVYTLVENNDSVGVNETVKLGRFSVTASKDDNELIPDSMKFADSMLKDSGLIKYGVKYTNSPTTSVVINE